MPDRRAFNAMMPARAMARATQQTVLGRFDKAQFSHRGISSSFFRRDRKFFVRTNGPDDKLGEFEFAYTLGVAPLQQYLVPLTDGRLQVLGIAWDTRSTAEGGQRWFDLYPTNRGSFVAGRRVLTDLTRQLLTLPFTLTGVAADVNRNPGAARAGFKQGNDGVVEYSSVHIAPVESGLVVKSSHSAQGNPHTMEEVRRLLRLHAGLPRSQATQGDYP